MSYLKLEKVSKSFGGLMAVSNVSLDVEKGSLVGLIGPNGAGKTTLFNLLTGVYVPSNGKIILNEETPIVLNGKKPHQIANLGIARTFQNIRLFKDLTVLDNIKIAMNRHVKYGLLGAFLRLPSFYANEKELHQEALDMLELVGLVDLADELAKNLPYGKQRELEIARALATGGKLLFLDEPAAGMNPNETAELTQFIFNIRKKMDLTIVLIEHDMSLVMKICEKISVLDYGKLIASGTADEIQHNKRVIEAYLGEEA